MLGLVVAGGLSSRMGEDKASLPLHTDETFLDRSFRILSSCVPTCFVSVGSGKRYLKYPLLQDMCERIGPLGALITGLSFAKEHGFCAVFALACDMPNISQTYVTRLLAHFAKQGCDKCATLYCNKKSGVAENLCAIYTLDALPYFLEAKEKRHFALRDCIPIEKQERLFYTEEEKLYFLNVNTKADLSLLLH